MLNFPPMFVPTAGKALALDTTAPAITVPQVPPLTLAKISDAGSAAAHPAVDFDAAGAAAAALAMALAASQPVDPDLTAIAALTTTSFGRGVLTVANAAALRGLAGLGTCAIVNTGTASGEVPIFSAGRLSLGTNTVATTNLAGIGIKLVLDGNNDAGGDTLQNLGQLKIGTTGGTQRAVVNGDVRVYSVGPGMPANPFVTNEPGGSYPDATSVPLTLWAYKDIRGKRYYSASVSFNPTTDADNELLHVTWDAVAEADGYVLQNDFFGGSQDVGNATSFDDDGSGSGWVAIDTSLTGDSVLIDNGSVTATGTVAAAAIKLNGVERTTWPSGGGVPGGSNTQVQFNDSGTFGGNSGLTYDPMTGGLYVFGATTIGATMGGQAFVFPDYAGNGELPSGALMGSFEGNFSFFPSINSVTVGRKLVLGYWNGGGRSAFEVGNVSSGNSTLYLMKSGGPIVVGSSTENGTSSPLQVAGRIQSLAGTGTSYASVGGSLFDHFADAGSTGTTETDLYSDSIAANSLATNGDYLEFDWGIQLVNSTSTKQVRLYFGGTLIFDSGALTISGSSEIVGRTIIERKTSTSIVTATAASTTGASTGSYANVPADVTGLTLSAANILKITGTAAGVGAANNDVLAKIGKVKYFTRT